MPKSQILTLYNKWLQTATQAQIELVDAIYAMCEQHYGAGGDVIVECFSPAEVLAEFKKRGGMIYQPGGF